MKFKKGDTVIVTSGRDKGHKGKIEKVLPDRDAVVVPGINVYKRHKKKRDEKHAGGIVEIVKPVGTGNIALVCPKCHQPTRVGYLVVGGEKDRICRKCEGKI